MTVGWLVSFCQDVASSCESKPGINGATQEVNGTLSRVLGDEGVWPTLGTRELREQTVGSLFFCASFLPDTYKSEYLDFCFRYSQSVAELKSEE